MEQWFFTKDGQQQGPVSAEEIQTMEKAGQLHPATTLVWRDGMGDWKSLADSGLLGGAPPLPTPQAPPVVSQLPQPAPGGAGYQQSVPSGYEAAAQYPGYGRLRYFLTYMAAVVAFYVVMAVVVFSMMSSSGSSGGGGAAVMMGFFVAFVIGMAAFLYIGYQRVINLGMSGWALLWTLVPFVNIWIGWRMMACPAGYDHHKTLDTAGKVITGLFVGFFLLAIVGNIAVAVMQG